MIKIWDFFVFHYVNLIWDFSKTRESAIMILGVLETLALTDYVFGDEIVAAARDSQILLVVRF